MAASEQTKNGSLIEIKKLPWAIFRSPTAMDITAAYRIFPSRKHPGLGEQGGMPAQAIGASFWA